ncbi:Pex19 domain-containing protein [Phanerochaete sordida]|uniref:Pex19 domain-containing protein n=1 Tax=Phanerochaete sordida TaxID=48140 RepID=A0A9P3GPE1_9APHY|nr:Pex19 domain-containing protein [Phanerochaete sordida]
MSKANMKSTRPKPDDDTDDLDDILGGFAGDKPKPKASAPSAPSTPGPSGSRPPAPPNTVKKPGLDDLNVGDDFARELAEGMAALMREIAVENGQAGAAGGELSDEDKQREASFRKAWEDMIVEGMNGALDTEDFDKSVRGKASAKPGEASKAQVGDDAFQSNLRSAMDKLKVSEDVAKENEAKPSDDENDAFEKLLAALGENGGESEEELQGMLETMMTQLMSKDVLYEPLKELHDKFPAYLKDNDATLKSEDKHRYEAQQRIVTEIVAIFEDPTYTPEDQEKGIKIVGLMNAMQNHGSPPPEIMGPLPPGLELGADGLPKLPDGCSIQ